MSASAAQFVTEPSVVAQALAAPAGGDAHAALRFGSAGALIAGLSPALADVVARRYAALLEPVAPALRLDVKRAERAGFRTIDTRGWENTMALAHDADGVVVVGRDFVARVDASGKRALVSTWCDDDFAVAPIENTLRIAAAYRSLLRGGVLLHSCGIVDDDVSASVARICFGPSGIGKSTLAAAWLARGRSILSDELCSIERAGGDDGGYEAAQLPFAGDVAAALVPGGALPLASLHRLAQGPVSRVDALGAKDAVTALIGCAPFVNVDRFRLPLLLANLHAVARALPPAKLTLALGDDPRPLFRAGIHDGARFALARSIRYRVIDDEAVVVLQQSAEVLGLNGTGSRAFDLAARGRTFKEIVDTIEGDTDVERGVLASDLRAFFADAVRDGLLEVRP
ncbi:MAG TPA: PqqD family protein [Myxococcota bacterium]